MNTKDFLIKPFALFISASLSLLSLFSIKDNSIKNSNINKCSEPIYFNSDDSPNRANHYPFEVCNYLDTFCAHYYMNLRENFAKNINGSCGYVALCALLSFYDTFMNDDIIPEIYDKPSSVNSNEIDYLTQHSPGVLKETNVPITSTTATLEDLINYISINMNTHLQCHLIEEGIDYGLTTLHIENLNNEFGMNTNEMVNLLEYYLMHDLHYYRFNDDYSICILNSPNQAAEYIERGIPVIGNIGYINNGTTVYHSTILYDINEDGDIFANFLQSQYSLYHENLYDYSVTFFQGIVLLPKKIPHKHSNNYVLVNNNTVCPCIRADHPCNDSVDLLIDSNYYKNVPPVLTIGELGILSADLYQVIFKDVDGNYLSYETNIYKPSLTASVNYNDWIDIQLHSGKIQLTIKRGYTINGITMYFYSSEHTFDPPRQSTARTNILDEYFNFPQSYCQYETTTICNVNNYLFIVKRLRCGYIQNNSIVLSPRKENCGVAYLEIDFYTENAYSIEFNLAFWSENEYLSNQDSVALFQTKLNYNNAPWVTQLDILNDGNLPTKDQYFKRFRLNLSISARYCRFYVETTPYGTWNKGRICIHDIIVSERLDNIYAD